MKKILMLMLAFLLVLPLALAVDKDICENCDWESYPDEDGNVNICYSSFGAVSPQNASFIFTPNESFTAEIIEFRVEDVLNADDDLYVDIYTLDSNNLPDVVLCEMGSVAEASISYYTDAPGASPVNSSGGSCALTAYTPYALVFYGDGSSDCNNKYLRVITDNSVGNSTSWRKTQGGAWTQESGEYGIFRIYGSPSTPPAGDEQVHINLTLNSPVNGTWYGVSQLISNNSNIWINVTHNATGEFTFNLNDTRFTLYSNTTTERIYKNNTQMGTGYYHINTSIIQDNSTNASDSTIFFIDLIYPTIIPLGILSGNATYVWNGTLVTQINFTDDNEIYKINISFCNGTEIYSRTNLGVTDYEVNISYGVDPSVLGCIQAEEWDSHTKEKIKDIDYELPGQGVKYVFEREWWFIDKAWIKIYPLDPENGNRASTEKDEDRYKFTLPKAKTYVVESSHYIDVPKKQDFDGHLIIPHINNGYWVDFMNDEGKVNNIKRISPTKIEIKISDLTSDMITFYSIGELNYVSTKLWYNNLNPEYSYSPHVLAGDNSYFNLTVTEYPSFISSINATAYYNRTPNYGGTSSNFSVTLSAPSFYGLNTSKNLNWVLEVNGFEHNLTSLSQTIHNIFLDNCSNTSFYKSATVKFKQVTNDNPVVVNSTLQMEGDFDFYATYEVANFSLCIYPNFVNISDEFDIQFTRSGNTQYYVNDFYFTNTSHTIINLYVQTGSSTTIFTIKDKDTSELLESVYSTMYALINGSYEVMESKYSDITGRVQFTYQSSIAYRFLLTKDGYSPYSFDLNPILFSSYDVFMEPDISWNISQDYDKVAIYYYPKEFINDRENNFTFMIHSPYDELIHYGYDLTYPGGSTSESGTAGVGEILDSNFTITGATESDRLRLDFYYETNISGLRNFTYYYSIRVGNNTMMANVDRTYGLGILERVLISVGIAVLVVGVGTLVGQPIPGFGLGLIILGYLSYIGFAPMWSVLMPIAIGLIILGSKPDG